MGTVFKRIVRDKEKYCGGEIEFIGFEEISGDKTGLLYLTEI